jgi:hypothetical protein
MVAGTYCPAMATVVFPGDEAHVAESVLPASPPFLCSRKEAKKQKWYHRQEARMRKIRRQRDFKRQQQQQQRTWMHVAHNCVSSAPTVVASCFHALFTVTRNCVSKLSVSLCIYHSSLTSFILLFVLYLFCDYDNNIQFYGSSSLP